MRNCLTTVHFSYSVSLCLSFCFVSWFFARTNTSPSLVLHSVFFHRPRLFHKPTLPFIASPGQPVVFFVLPMTDASLRFTPTTVFSSLPFTDQDNRCLFCSSLPMTDASSSVCSTTVVLLALGTQQGLISFGSSLPWRTHKVFSHYLQMLFLVRPNSQVFFTYPDALPLVFHCQTELTRFFFT